MAPKNKKRRSGRRANPMLVALSSAAVMSIYGAGYLRTKAAAESFSDGPAQRRRPIALPAAATAPSASSPVLSAVVPVPAPAPTVSADTPRVPSSVAAPSVRSASTRETAPLPLPATLPSTAAVEQMVTTPTLLPSSEAHLSAPPVAIPVVTTAPVAPAAPPAPKYKDGIYAGWGTSRHGDIEATVTVASGRIVRAVISQCLTQYSCSWIDPLPPQVLTRQSAEVDYISGATQSANAFYYALTDALSKAK